MSKKIINVESLPEETIDDSLYCINQTKPNKYTHGLFKYPCKFIPEIPRWAIKKYATNSEDLIMDPFAGSGTSLLEANILGYDACGTEIDDIAKLIIQVKTTRLNEEQILNAKFICKNILADIQSHKSSFYRPCIRNLEHWFDDDNINSLGLIYERINEVADEDLAAFFSACFVSIIKRVSLCDDISPKPYVSSKIKKIPSRVYDEFFHTFEKYVAMVEELNSVGRFGKTTIVDGNALNFSIDGMVDLAVTSPPYINAFDYARTLRLENLWLGTISEEELLEKKSSYVGTERFKSKEEIHELEILKDSDLLSEVYMNILSKDIKKALIVKKFYSDMKKNLKVVHSVLKERGKYIIVIGNSQIKDVPIENWRIIADIGMSLGFDFDSHFSYVIQNPYIRIPRNGQGGKISDDHILVLSK